MRLPDRVAIVTGASAGIGRAIALRLADEGAHLSLVARRWAKLEEVANAIRAKGRMAIALKVDVGRLEDLRRMVEETVRTMGRAVDILVNNAAIRLDKPIGEVTEEEWD